MLQLHLVQQPLTALGARAKALALHLGDQSLGAGELRTCFGERRLERIYVVGELIRYRHHESTESRTMPPARYALSQKIQMGLARQPERVVCRAASVRHHSTNRECESREDRQEQFALGLRSAKA